MGKMPPYEIRDDEHSIGSVFILRSPWRDDYANLMLKQGIEGLRLPSVGYGFKAQPIDFIAELEFLRSVQIYSFDITDLTPLSKLTRVEVLGLQVKKALGIEKWRPPLRVLLARWCKQLAPMLSIRSLEYVNITNYPHVDLRNLRTPRLQRLALTSKKLESLSGAEDFPRLERVDLYNCPNLHSVDELSTVRTMKILKIEACRHVSSKRAVIHFGE